MAKTNKATKTNGDSNWGWSGSHGQPWIPGVVLILIGVVFLLQNFGNFELDNWWALFILFPAVRNLSTAYQAYQSDGSFNRLARGHLFWGLFFVLLSASFLLELNFGLLWPAFLILGGLGMLLGAL